MFFDKIYESWRDIQYEKYKFIFPIIKKYYDGRRILDIGCGHLFFEQYVESIQKEIRQKMIAVDVHGNGVDVICDGSFLPFKKIFGIVISIDSAHKFDTDDVKNVLMDDGIFIVALPEKFSEHFKKIRMKNVESFVLPTMEKEIVKVYSPK